MFLSDEVGFRDGSIGVETVGSAELRIVACGTHIGQLTSLERRMCGLDILARKAAATKFDRILVENVHLPTAGVPNE